MTRGKVVNPLRDDLLKQALREQLKAVNAGDRAAAGRAARLTARRAARAPQPERDRIATQVEALTAAAQAPATEAEGGGAHTPFNAEEFIDQFDVTFADVKGLDALVDMLDLALLTARAETPPDGPRVEPLRRVLLYGPPGTGKTFIAAACSHELNATFYNADSRIERKYVGDSPAVVRGLFGHAREQQAAVLFFDEIDQWSDGGGEGAGRTSIHNTLLTELDGLKGTGRGSVPFVLAATNRPERLSPALLSRFDVKLFVDLPDAEARAAIIQAHTLSKRHRFDGDVTIARLAAATGGYSGRELKSVCSHAVMQMLHALNPRKSRTQGSPSLRTGPLSESHFKAAMEAVRPAVTGQQVAALRAWRPEA